MVAHNALMRIFWPADAPMGLSPGVLVGFRNSEFDVFVVALLQHVDLPKVENALLVGTLLRHPNHDIQNLLQRCRHASLRVLGHVNPQTAPVRFNPQLLATYTDASTRFPRVYCPMDTPIALQVIVYDRPHPTRMQYLSIHPMSLALGDKVDAVRSKSAFEVAQEEQRGQKRKDNIMDKLKLHTVIAYPTTHQETSLPMIIDQINCSYELNTVLQSNIGLVRRIKRAQSVSQRVAESANNLWDYFYIGLHFLWKTWLYPIIAQLFIIVLLAHRIGGEVILQVLHWRPGSPEAPALKDISATAQQLDIRLQQFCYWPIQYLTLRKRKGNWESFTSSHPEYIRFYNSLWLVANDVIIGIALGSFIIENSVFVASQLDIIFNTWSIEGLHRTISWLMEWPGGLKLNTELAEFLGDLFLWVIDHWAGTCIMILLEGQY